MLINKLYIFLWIVPSYVLWLIKQVLIFTYALKAVAKYLCLLIKNEFSITGMFNFPDLLKKSSNDESYEDVSYDVEGLCTSIPVQETIDYILQRICS